MKKILTVSILFVMLISLCTSMVSATTGAQLPDVLFSIASKYGATGGDKIKIERFLADNPVTDAQADAVVAKANEIAKVLDDAGVTDAKKLSASDKNKVKTLANEAASVVGVTLSFKDQNVEVYKDGKLIESTATVINTAQGGSGSSSAASGATKLVYTGSNGYIALAIGSVVVVALSAVIIRKKNNA